MKKLVSSILIFSMLFMFAACSDADRKEQTENSIFASYSIKSDGENFIAEVQNLGGVYADFYDADGLYIEFKDEEKIYDSEGRPIKREELSAGQTLQIFFDGELSKKHPKTIEAYKVVVIV